MESCFVTSMEAQDDNSAGLDELWNVISKEGVNINSRSVTTASSVTDSILGCNSSDLDSSCLPDCQQLLSNESDQCGDGSVGSVRRNLRLKLLKRSKLITESRNTGAPLSREPRSQTSAAAEPYCAASSSAHSTRFAISECRLLQPPTARDATLDECRIDQCNDVVYGTFWSSALPADDASSATDDRCAPVRARLRQILVQRAAAMLREELPTVEQSGYGATKTSVADDFLNQVSTEPVQPVIEMVAIPDTAMEQMTIQQVEQQSVDPAVICASLLQILPTCDEYHYKIIERETASTKDHFTASFTVNVNDREEFDEWKKKFEKKTTTQYTIRDTKPCKGEQVTQLNFKQYLKCVHNVKRGKLGLRKHTACPAEMTVTISNDSKCSNSSRCRVDLSWVHNHTILAADVIRRHRVSSATDAKLIDLFTHGHSPSTALQYIRTEIEESLQDGERLEVALANRSICPDNYHCQYVFRKLFSKEYGEPNDNTHLDTFIEKINAEQGIECVAREEYSGKNLVAICTPFMRRVHENIEEAAELMFVDSTGGLDRDGFRVFILLTHSKAGGVPLAVGITPSESVEALTKLFSLVKRILPDNCFYRRGRDHGPQLIMTDDCAAEQEALLSVWPHSRQLLCQFHVLQAQWRWLLQSQHGIAAADRPQLFQHVKQLMYARTVWELNTHYESFLTSALSERYPNFKEHLCAVFDKKKMKWCSAYRVGALLRGNHTNNYVESSMRILKDQIFKRLRAFNLVQMTHFITERLSTYYERRLLDYANYRELRLLTKKFPSYEGQQISLLSADIYEVESISTEGLSYTVNIAACLCTCYEGATGKLCKHIHYVLTEKSLNFTDNYCLGENRHLMYFVACGSAPPPGWLDTLHSTAHAEQSVHSVHIATDHIGSVDAIANHSSDTDVGVQLRLESKQAEFVELWKAKIDSHSNRSAVELLAAYEAAIRTLQKVTTANAAVSLVHTVGKYSEAGCCKRRKLGNIPVQTTSVARRRKCLRGRAPGEPGRPRKMSVLAANKHDYSMPMRKYGQAASHNLQYCVRRNAALGRTHSKK